MAFEMLQKEYEITPSVRSLFYNNIQGGKHMNKHEVDCNLAVQGLITLQQCEFQYQSYEQDYPPFIHLTTSPMGFAQDIPYPTYTDKFYITSYSSVETHLLSFSQENRTGIIDGKGNILVPRK